jgi:hypothetical protein
MNPNPLEQPVPALAVAVGLAVLSQKATGKAARALGVPVAVLSVLLAGALALGELKSG